jgi:hypothetical protein
VVEAIGQGEFRIGGLPNTTLRKLPQVSRTIKRPRTHGLVKETALSYKCHLTALGREVAAPLAMRDSGGVSQRSGRLIFWARTEQNATTKVLMVAASKDRASAGDWFEM